MFHRSIGLNWRTERRLRIGALWILSSVGQSIRLITGRSSVQVREGPFYKEDFMEENMENLKLYRTIGFETFADLMLYGEERYMNPQQWKDTHEGYVFRLMDTEEGRKILIKKLYEHYGKEEKVVDIFSRYYSLYHG